LLLAVVLLAPGAAMAKGGFTERRRARVDPPRPSELDPAFRHLRELVLRDFHPPEHLLVDFDHLRWTLWLIEELEHSDDPRAALALRLDWIWARSESRDWKLDKLHELENDRDAPSWVIAAVDAFAREH
jgi:hypothetical protein